MIEGGFMAVDTLYSVVMQLKARNSVSISATTGHLVHAMFLNLIKRFDAALSARLHDEPGYRPFTVSSLLGVPKQGNQIALQEGQICYLRLTLLDGGMLWYNLNNFLLGTTSVTMNLGSCALQLVRIFSSSLIDPTGWARTTNWQSLVSVPATRSITFSFETPTAFNLGDREFLLFPEPLPLWESLMRVWNNYSPLNYKMERQLVRESVVKSTVVAECNLWTETLYFPKYTQKGFTGTCRYTFESENDMIRYLAILAAFAPYSGIGYKTTMGMGQVRVEMK
jgi:CRISPR-associated endoribonuclease Cas6